MHLINKILILPFVCAFLNAESLLKTNNTKKANILNPNTKQASIDSSLENSTKNGEKISNKSNLNFSKCAEFYTKTSKQFIDLKNENTINAIHIGDGKYLAYSKHFFNNKNIIKYDEFMGLYLFKDKILNQKYDFRVINKSIQAVAINKNSITKGKILKSQGSLKNLAVFSNIIEPNSIISDICYQAYGISTGSDRFIDKSYIDLFLKNKNSKEYSYIGIEAKDSKNGVVISKINPFITNLLQIGDILLSINGKKINSVDDFFNLESNLEINKIAYIDIKRGNKILKIPLIATKREIDFSVQDSFLQYFGIVLDNNLNIISDNKSERFKPNDKILRVNQMQVSTINELDSALAKIANEGAESFSILLNRNDFEFFITIPIDSVELI
ncbi:MAG: PDZ domain-containing protein [Helicobacteraceae bacterium]|nr:PDZ domain-containing protein [Helicobacteraceae bacterium]